MILFGLSHTSKLLGRVLSQISSQVIITYTTGDTRRIRTAKDVLSLPDCPRADWDQYYLYRHFLECWHKRYRGAEYCDQLSIEQRSFRFEMLIEQCGGDVELAASCVDALFSQRMEWLSPPKVSHIWNLEGRNKHQPAKLLKEYILPVASDMQVAKPSGERNVTLSYTGKREERSI